MNERELLVDCLRRLNRTGVTYYLTGSMASMVTITWYLSTPPSGRIWPRLMAMAAESLPVTAAERAERLKKAREMPGAFPRGVEFLQEAA